MEHEAYEDNNHRWAARQLPHGQHAQVLLYFLHHVSAWSGPLCSSQVIPSFKETKPLFVCFLTSKFGLFCVLGQFC